MRARTQVTILEICLAFVCALGAGLTGDLFAHHSQHSNQAGRHHRGTNHRSGVRSVSRQSHEDHAVEIDNLHSRDSSAAVAGTDGPDTAAVAGPPGPPGQAFSVLTVVCDLLAPSLENPQLALLRPRAPPDSL